MTCCAELLPIGNIFYTSNLSLKNAVSAGNPFNESFPKAAVEDLELGYRLEQQRALKSSLFTTQSRIIFTPPASCRRVGERTILVRQCDYFMSFGRILHHQAEIRRSAAAFDISW